MREKKQWSLFSGVSGAWYPVQSTVQVAQDVTSRAHPGTRHLWHSWHLYRSWELGLIRNTLSVAVSGSGINRSQSNQALLISFKSCALPPPWHNDVFLMERKVQGNLSRVENDVVVWVLQSHEAKIHKHKHEHMATQTSYGGQMVSLKHFFVL